MSPLAGASAPLSSLIAPTPLPLVTAVFCSAEGGKQYASWRRLDAREVHLELLTVMRNILRQIPGGYLVKHRDGDLKYLVVFSSPEVIVCVEWACPSLKPPPPALQQAALNCVGVLHE